MKLGEILSQEDNARLLVGHDVEFWIKKGNAQRRRAEAADEEIESLRGHIESLKGAIRCLKGAIR